MRKKWTRCAPKLYWLRNAPTTTAGIPSRHGAANSKFPAAVRALGLSSNEVEESLARFSRAGRRGDSVLPAALAENSSIGRRARPAALACLVAGGIGRPVWRPEPVRLAAADHVPRSATADAECFG